MGEIEPGTYDGVVVEAEGLDDDAVSLEIALTSGAHKGATVRIRGPRRNRDPLSLLGLPATLDVREDGIRMTIDGD